MTKDSQKVVNQSSFSLLYWKANPTKTLSRVSYAMQQESMIVRRHSCVPYVFLLCVVGFKPFQSLRCSLSSAVGWEVHITGVVF